MAVLPGFTNAVPGMLIDGLTVEARSGARLDVENPATGAVIATTPAGDAADAAVAAARRSFKAGTWRCMSAVQREKILWRFSGLVEARINDLVTLDVLDNGMPIGSLTRAIERAVDGLRY